MRLLTSKSSCSCRRFLALRSFFSRFWYITANRRKELLARARQPPRVSRVLSKLDGLDLDGHLSKRLSADAGVRRVPRWRNPGAVRVQRNYLGVSFYRGGLHGRRRGPRTLSTRLSGGLIVFAGYRARLSTMLTEDRRRSIAGPSYRSIYESVAPLKPVPRRRLAICKRERLLSFNNLAVEHPVGQPIGQPIGLPITADHAILPIRRRARPCCIRLEVVSIPREDSRRGRYSTWSDASSHRSRSI